MKKCRNSTVNFEETKSGQLSLKLRLRPLSYVSPSARKLDYKINKRIFSKSNLLSFSFPLRSEIQLTFGLFSQKGQLYSFQYLFLFFTSFFRLKWKFNRKVCLIKSQGCETDTIKKRNKRNNRMPVLSVVDVFYVVFLKFLWIHFHLFQQWQQALRSPFFSWRE